MTMSSGEPGHRRAYEVVADSRPRGTYRGAVVGCGRMGSTIDDEHVGMPHYPWPWAHAPAMIEAAGVELVAGVDLDKAKLQDFHNRWGVRGLYTDVRQMVEAESPDIVSVTTRPEERPDVIAALAEAGVKAIFATKPLCRTLAQADEMIDVCRRNNTILTMACHLNWYAPYSSARGLIERGEIGPLRSMVANTTSSLSNIGSHTLSLFRMFVSSPARWVFGHMDDDAAVLGDGDLDGSGYVVYDNGVRAFLNSPGSPPGRGRWSSFASGAGLCRAIIMPPSSFGPRRSGSRAENGATTRCSVCSPTRGDRAARWWTP